MNQIALKSSFFASSKIKRSLPYETLIGRIVATAKHGGFVHVLRLKKKFRFPRIEEGYFNKSST